MRSDQLQFRSTNLECIRSRRALSRKRDFRDEKLCTCRHLCKLWLRIHSLITDMKSQPRIGAIDTLAFVVKAEHAIDFSDQVMPHILSTPWLIWFLEHAARQLMLPHLEDEESTVGARVDVEHLSNTGRSRSSLPGQTHFLRSTAFSFELRAWDHLDLVARAPQAESHSQTSPG